MIEKEQWPDNPLEDTGHRLPKKEGNKNDEL
jgi:hypothetical protein